MLTRDLEAPKVYGVRMATEQNYQKGKEGGIHRPFQCLSDWQAHETTTKRTAMTAQSLHPIVAEVVPWAAAATYSQVGNPDCTAPHSASIENIEISVFCFEWKEVEFQITKVF